MRQVHHPLELKTRHLRGEDTCLRQRDGERKEVLQDRLQFCPVILKHVPGKGFVTVRHYGFYHQKYAGKLDRLNESLGKAGRRHRNRRQRRRDKEKGLYKASYRYLCIKTFKRDPLKCSC